MGKRYGSKAAYESARAGIRANRDEWERWHAMTEEERAKRRNKERLEGDEAMMTFSLFMASAMAGGADAKKAIGQADVAISELKRRFT
jgi:hypothetical protein